MLNNLPDWLPPFTVRKNHRSRGIRLKMCAQKGLQLVVPKSFKLKDAEPFMQQHRVWIEKNWLKLHQSLSLRPNIEQSQSLQLLALDETWYLDFHAQDTVSVKVIEAEGALKHLILRGDIQQKTLVNKALRSWLQIYAKRRLLSWLADLSQRTGLSYTKATVRYAHTRWGSCSSQKHIMLNVKLVFLPKALVEYVILHELCHTVHMNHSQAFWDLLQSVNPNCHQLRQQLKSGDNYVPHVLDHSSVS